MDVAFTMALVAADKEEDTEEAVTVKAVTVKAVVGTKNRSPTMPP
jgi:hypothetical protein